MVKSSTVSQDADDLGALQHLRDLALPGDQRRGLLGRADGRGRVDLDAVEMHTGIASSPGRPTAVARRARRARPSGTRNWRTAPSHRATTSRTRALGTRLDAVLDTVDAEARRRSASPSPPARAVPTACPARRPPTTPTISPETSDSIVVLVVFGRLDQPGQHGADRMQRSRCDRLTDQLGDQCEVGDAIARDAAAAEFLGHQQARPAEFGGAPPPVVLERRYPPRAVRAPGSATLPSPGTTGSSTRTAVVRGRRLRSRRQLAFDVVRTCVPTSRHARP